MDEFEKQQMANRIATALEIIASELTKMNDEGITVWGGSTVEEN